MGSVGGELIHQIDYHTQPKTAAPNYVRFVLIHLKYCTDVYQYILQVLICSQTQDFSESDMLSPGGQV